MVFFNFGSIPLSVLPVDNLNSSLCARCVQQWIFFLHVRVVHVFKVVTQSLKIQFVSEKNILYLHFSYLLWMTTCLQISIQMSNISTCFHHSTLLSFSIILRTSNPITINCQEVLNCCIRFDFNALPCFASFHWYKCLRLPCLHVLFKD